MDPKKQENTSLYGYFRLLSLDVALGALGGGCMVAAYLPQAMHWSWYVVLPLATWCIYTADHLMDARRLGPKASTARHRFHHRNFQVLAGLAGAGTLAAIALAVSFLGLTGLLFGIGMGCVAGVHLALVRLVGQRSAPWLAKELGVALVYTAGIWGLPILLSEDGFTRQAMFPAVQFLLMALVNLLEFSLYEYDTDLADGQTSFVQAVGRKVAIRFIRLLLAASAGLGTFLLMDVNTRPVLRLELIYAVMTLILAALIFRPTWFATEERYRIWGDAAFLMPFIYLILALG